MYKVLIVDDEKNIRERLSGSFPWKELGFEVIGTARDGKEAMELVHRHVPHVVLTDILMPEMNGLELAKSIREDYPHSKVLLLTAYDDFKYAQEAIRYGIKGYLLKPLMKKEFLEIFQGLADELNNDEELARTKQVEEERARNESMLIQLLKGNDTTHLNADWQHKFFRIGLFSFEKWDEKLTLSAKRRLTDLSVQYWKKDRALVLFYGNQLVLFWHGGRPISKYDLKGKLEEFIDYMKEVIRNEFAIHCEVSVGVGNLAKDAGQIYTSYNQAIYAYSYKYFHEFDTIIFYQDVSVVNPGSVSKEQAAARVNRSIDTLTKSILSQQTSERASKLAEFFDSLKQTEGLHIDEVRIAFSELIFSLLLKAKETKKTIVHVNKKEAIEQIYGIESLSELKKWLRQLLEKVEVVHAGDQDGNRYIQLAKQHVHDHYANKITLEDMANRLFIHPAYFSSIFKKDTGQNFIDYVNEVRVRKAADMLMQQDYKIKVISELVGFQNHSYFIKVFKKVTGARPLEYRSHSLS